MNPSTTHFVKLHACHRHILSFPPPAFSWSCGQPQTTPSQLAQLLLQRSPISSLKVAWRKDPLLDAATDLDKRWRLCSRVVREVLHEPGSCIPLRYLEKRRERLRLPVKAATFLTRYPNLFELYPDRIKPKSQLVPFLRPSARLRSFLADEAELRARHEPLALAKLCKLLMISKDKVIPAEKLFNVKRDFGLPDDFLCSIVPKYPHLLRLTGGADQKSFLELVSWNADFAKSVIDRRAEEELQATGVSMRPNFTVRLPPGFYLRREMREWVRDWLEIPYISPYADASGLRQGTPEMEKRTIGVLHEVLSLTLLKRMAVPVIGKFCEEFLLSNAFGSAFTRHSGIFYVSLKGGIRTAMLREAYDKGQLVDRDPLLEIKDKFELMLEEGHLEYKERMLSRKEAMQKDLELMAKRNAEQGQDESLPEDEVVEESL